MPHYRAEILTIFGGLVENDDFINSFWNSLTLQRSIFWPSDASFLKLTLTHYGFIIRHINFLGYGGGGGGGGRWSTTDGQQRNDRWDRSGSGGGDRGQNFYNGAGQGGGNTRWQEPPSGNLEKMQWFVLAGGHLFSFVFYMDF